MSLEDKARSWRPLDATDEEMCIKVWDPVLYMNFIRAQLSRAWNFEVG